MQSLLKGNHFFIGFFRGRRFLWAVCQCGILPVGTIEGILFREIHHLLARQAIGDYGEEGADAEVVWHNHPLLVG